MRCFDECAMMVDIVRECVSRRLRGGEEVLPKGRKGMVRGWCEGGVKGWLLNRWSASEERRVVMLRDGQRR